MATHEIKLSISVFILKQNAAETEEVMQTLIHALKFSRKKKDLLPVKNPLIQPQISVLHGYPTRKEVEVRPNYREADGIDSEIRGRKVHVSYWD